MTVAYLDVVVGTETGANIDGARLDFIDLQLPVPVGSFDSGEATVVWDGVEGRATDVEGTHTDASGSFVGTLEDGRPLSGTFACGSAGTGGGEG